MIDFIQVTKHLGNKDKLFLGHLEHEAQYSSGWNKYLLKGCEKIEIYWNPENSILRLKGSIMYYWQGHNFSYSKEGFLKAIEHINRILNVNLWDSIIQAFEYGIIMRVKYKPKEYIKRHSAGKAEKLIMNEKGKDKGNFRWWVDSNVSLKMYDASKNILMKQGTDRKTIIEEEGWNPEGHFLKWEAHYLKPEILNHGKGLMLANLMNPQWENIFKEDLYSQYKRLIPMKTIITPTNKKDLGTSSLILLTMAESEINNGATLQEVKKRLYDKINIIPDSVLSKADKDSRKRQIKIIIDRIKESPESDWDLSKGLEETLLKE